MIFISTGDKGDYYAEQFCTLSVNAAWSRFKLLGAGCYDNQDEISLENVVTGRNLLLSMAYENATKLGAANNRGYQFVQLQVSSKIDLYHWIYSLVPTWKPSYFSKLVILSC